MDTYTISFFGHRVIERPLVIAQRLEELIQSLAKQKEYVEFLVGRDGEFDSLVSSAIRKVTKNNDYGNTAHVLVLPYMRAEYRDNEEYFLNYYDEVEICARSCNAHYKSAIMIRNRDMIDRSDLVVCYVEHNKGGAYSSMQYAVKQGKNVINIIEMI